MRDEDALETAKEAIERRMEEIELPFLLAFQQPKRDVIVGILHGDDDPDEIIEATRSRLREDISLAEYVQIQAAQNAAAWCAGDLDSI